MITIRNFERVFIANQKRRVSRMDYKSKIIQMIENINNNGTLEYLHTFIKLFLEKWG